jgi:hypothetical protein
MWIQNSSRFPDRAVGKLVRLATGDIDMRRVCVNVKNGELAGAAYDGVPDVSNAPPNAEYLITLRVGRGYERWPMGPINYHFQTPEETGPRNRFPFFTYRDWREWLVKLAAHEAMHVEQFRLGGRCSELDCERFAANVLDGYRAARGAAQQAPGLSGAAQVIEPAKARPRPESAQPAQLVLPGFAL